MRPDRTTAMTTVFTQNYIEDLPVEIQFQIMKTVEDTIKQDKIDDLYRRLDKYLEGPTEHDDAFFESIVGEDILYMLRCACDIEKQFEDKFDYTCWMFETLNSIYEDDFQENNIDRMTKLVNHYGVIKALKKAYTLLSNEIDVYREEDSTYRQLYFTIVYEEYKNISYEDILLMKELGINP